MNPMQMNPEVNLDHDFHYEGKHSAAEDVIAAHHERSPDRLMHALANFIDLHLHAKEGNKPEPYGSEV